MKRVLKILLVLIVLLVVLVVCLPWLASTGGVRGMVLAKVNEAMPGTVAIDDWSFRWLGSSSVDGISFEDGQGTKVNVSGVRIEKGLIALARNPNDFGRVEVIAPVATVALPDEPEAAAPAGEAPPAEKRPPSEKPSEAEPAKPIPMPDYHGTFVVTDGSVSVVKPDGTTVSAVRDLAVDVGLNGAGEPLTYTVSFASGEAEGTMQVKGEANLGSGKELVPEEATLDTVVNIEALDLGALSALAGVAAAPEVKGALTGKVSVKGGLANGLGVIGTMKIPGMSMSGGPFKGDTPSLGDVLLNVNGTFADESISVSNLLFRSSLANLSAGGRVGKDADGEFTVDATIDLAAALSQFPETAGLQEGVTLDEGKVKIAAKVAREGTTSLVEANAGIERLRGAKDGQVLSWDVPTTVDVKGAVGEDLMKLDLFRIQSSFLTAEGKGDMENMDATIHADVRTALTELRKFVKIEPWDAAGQLDLSFHMEPGEQNRRAVSGTVSMEQATVSKAGKTLVPTGPLQVNLSTQVRLPDATQGLEALGSQVSWKAWLGEGNLNVDRVQLPLPSPTGETPMPTVEGLHDVAQVDLARVTDLLHALELLDADLRLAGGASIQAKLSIDEERLDLTDASIEIASLLVGEGEKELREALLTVRTAGVIEPTSGSVNIPALDLTFSPGAVRVRDVTVGRGERDELALKARVEGDLNLATLLTTLGDFAALPEGTQVAGTTKLRLNVDAPGKGQSRVEAKADVENLRVTSKDGPPIAEDKIELAAIVLQDPATSAVVLENLTVASVPVNLSATANFVPGESRKDLTADGSVALDLVALGDYLNALVGMDVVLKGKEERPFHLRTSWTGAEGENVMTRTEFSAGLSAELIEAFGMRVESLDVPLLVSNGVARVDISAGVNEGQMALRPVIDFTPADAQLVLENPSNVLVNVKLTKAIAEQLLSRIHPLFKGASSIDGTLNLSMDEFAWPLDPAARDQAVFNGVMNFSELSLSSAGFLGKILDVAKIKEKDLNFGDQKIEFACKDGRITCSPTRIKVDGHELELSGSVGLDQSLDYAALLPVTVDLVGSNAFEYLEGTTIRMPIGGTVSKPDLGAHVVTKAVADLTKQAVKNAARKTIEKEAGKLLEGLFR